MGVAQAKGTQGMASVLRTRRAAIAAGSAWTVFGSRSKELYEICSRSLVGVMQPHRRLAWMVVDA